MDKKKHQESFQQALASVSKSKGDATRKMLDNLIKELELVKDASSGNTAKRKTVAKKLQKFFDTLGDNSFYATKDCLREASTMMGV